MTRQTFFEKFDLFAALPDATAAIRGIVRQLAIQGRLATQDEEDGDASSVITAILQERQDRAAELRIPVEPDPMAEDGKPFQIPARWEWTQLGKIALQIQYGYTASADPAATDVRMLRITDIQNNRVDWPSVPGCQIQPNEAERYLLRPNDILIARTGGTIGKSFIVPETPVKSVFASYLIRVTPPKSIEARYLKLTLESPLYWEQLRAMSAGTGQPNVNGQALGRLAVPIPPRAEQARIVTRVDELMSLCDTLDAQGQNRVTRQAELARASLARFADAPTPANVNLLFHKSYDVTPADIQNSVLSLAVQGKLVPQKSDEESAISCLRRLNIAPDCSSGDDELLPSGWTLVRFVDIALIVGGVTLGRKLGGQATVTLPYLRVANVKRGEIDLEVIKEVSIAQDEIDRYSLRENDLLMTEGGDWDKVGRAAIWRGQIEPCLHQNHVFRLRMRSAEIAPEWFEIYVNSPVGRRYFESASKQTTNLASINMRQVRECPVPFPPLSEQKRIVSKVQALKKLVHDLSTQLVMDRISSSGLLNAIAKELTD